jgi:hypothetical protein
MDMDALSFYLFGWILYTFISFGMSITCARLI